VNFVRINAHSLIKAVRADSKNRGSLRTFLTPPRFNYRFNALVVVRKVKFRCLRAGRWVARCLLSESFACPPTRRRHTRCRPHKPRAQPESRKTAIKTY